MDLDAAKRARTIIRVDAGGGSLGDINWLLQRGYQIQGKDYSRQRANLLAQSVQCWFNDPQRPDRQVGWVTVPAPEYVRPVVRIAVRYRQQNGQWTMGTLLSTLQAALRSAIDRAAPRSRRRSTGGLVGIRRLLRSTWGRGRNLVQGGQAGIGHDHAYQKAL